MAGWFAGAIVCTSFDNRRDGAMADRTATKHEPAYRGRSALNCPLALEDALASAKSDAKAPRKLEYGAAAAASGHAHMFATFKKLPLPMRTALVEDLARIAAWSGQGNKVRGGAALSTHASLLGRVGQNPPQ
eukprot:358364-Chlamydomonas_euryale.AAC.3